MFLLEYDGERGETSRTRRVLLKLDITDLTVVGTRV